MRFFIEPNALTNLVFCRVADFRRCRLAQIGDLEALLLTVRTDVARVILDCGLSFPPSGAQNFTSPAQAGLAGDGVFAINLAIANYSAIDITLVLGLGPLDLLVMPTVRY